VESEQNAMLCSDGSLISPFCLHPAVDGAKKSESSKKIRRVPRRRLFYLSRFLSLSTIAQCTVAVLPDRVKTALGGGGSRPLDIGVFE